MSGDAADKAKKPVVTPDTIKLPPMRKPNWMGQVEDGLLTASPPVIGPQARANAKFLLFAILPPQKNKQSKLLLAYPCLS